MKAKIKRLIKGNQKSKKTQKKSKKTVKKRASEDNAQKEETIENEGEELGVTHFAQPQVRSDVVRFFT